MSCKSYRGDGGTWYVLSISKYQIIEKRTRIITLHNKYSKHLDEGD